MFESVYDTIVDRKEHPKEGSYTNYLFEKGIDKILKKVGEEATEIVIAAKNPNPEEVKYEVSDFLYHVMVLMVERGSPGRILSGNWLTGSIERKDGAYSFTKRGETMNESEKRRKKLLEETGACTATGGPRLPYTPDTGRLTADCTLGRDRRGMPGTFGLRAFCCFLLFAPLWPWTTRGERSWRQTARRSQKRSPRILTWRKCGRTYKRQ